MRFLVVLCLTLLVSGCATQPIDLDLPEDHPANPMASGSAPGDLEYIYSLPASRVPQKEGMTHPPHEGMTTGSSDKDANPQHPSPAKIMHPHEHGKANED